jgi:sigma-B regulation protein RsbU (phosphoserine phosphatase)
MRIVPHRDETGAVLWLIHHAVRLELKPPTASGLKERLQALDMDPKLIMAAYRAQVMERLIRPLHFGAAQLVQPLEEVGGDLLWHHEYEDGTTHLVLADVMGHGLEAARLAAKLVLMLDSIAETRRSGAENVATLNRLLLDMPQVSGEPELHPRYATGLYLCLSPDDHYLKVCSFGHSGPIFSKAGHFAVEGGLPIGMMEEEEPWPEETLHLATHGRRFLIFTDGVTEQFNMDGEMFGEAGLEREFHRTLDLPLPRMVEQTSACIDAFRGQALVKDDRALLGLESMA